MEIKILETFVFDGKAFPFSLLGYWGCTYTLCPHGQRVRPGERCHKIEVGGDVDLVHPDCLDEMKKKISIPQAHPGQILHSTKGWICTEECHGSTKPRS